MSCVGFLSGISFTTFLASALFFFKFWKASRDRFFLYFACACVLIAIDRAIGLYIPTMQSHLWSQAMEKTAWAYLARIAAFTLITIGILEKNRASRGR